MSKGPKASLGCLFWIAIILLAVVIFLFNQKAITGVIQRFRFGDGDAPRITLTSPPPRNEGTATPPPTESPDRPAVPTPPAPSPSPSPAHTAKPDEKHPTGTTVAVSPSPSSSPAPSSRESVLYFIYRNGNDIQLKSVKRRVVHRDAPLTATLKALLGGPSTDERRASMISLIPANSRLLDVAVRGDTAFISFSEEFRFNDYGVPGLQAQIKQIVYTATEFPTVAKVQFLINGKKVNNLAQEGVYIGNPLSRTSF
jgi:germination protein M